MPKGNHIDAETLRAALIGYQHEQSMIEEKIAELTRKLAGKAVNPQTAGTPKAKRHMSAAGRRRIAAAQRKRWAELKKGDGAGKRAARQASTKKSSRKKRKLSAEGRKRIIEATRKRWEAFRAKKAASTA